MNDFKARHQDQFDWIEANKLIRQSGVPNYVGCQIRIPSPWNVELFEELLTGYEDKEIIQFLKFGWPVETHDLKQDSTLPKNQKEARDNIGKVVDYLKDEIRNCSILGPLLVSPFDKVACFSPIDAIPKKDSSDLRIILNLSHPFDEGSVNQAVSKDHYLGSKVDLSYPGIDALIKLIRKKGRGCYLFKRDLRKFYRQIRLDPGFIHLLGYTFLGLLFFDVTLPMGLRIACYIAQRISNALMFAYNRLEYEGVNYLDDLAAAEIRRLARKAFEQLGKLLADLGIWEAVQKSCEPLQIMVFLGVLFNSKNMTLEITPECLESLLKEIEVWLDKNTVTIKQVQSLIGKLNFAAATVYSGRVFMMRLFNFLRALYAGSSHYIPLGVKKDLKWWYLFLKDFNGISMIPEIRWLTPDVKISTDSSLVTCGGWSEGHYFHTAFPEFIRNLRNVHINELECLAIVVALKLWAKKYRSKNLLLYCDNETTVQVVNKGFARNEFAQKCFREIVWVTAHNDVWVKVVYLPGVRNHWPDYSSRWTMDKQYMEKFLKEIDGLRKKQEKVTDHLFKFTHDW